MNAERERLERISAAWAASGERGNPVTPRAAYAVSGGSSPRNTIASRLSRRRGP